MALAAAEQARHIGRFEIVRVLGEGAQGKVYLARDTRLDRKVAVKTLHVNGANAVERAAHIRALMDEARIVSGFQHPNIVTLHDAGEFAGGPFLVFEYVDGQTLSGLIAESGRIAPPRAVEIILQVLAGIGCAHERNLVHRDLKPANVMLGTSGAARVMDFGIAAAGGGEADDALFGTPAYMAPEYITSRRFSPRSDLFAAGMMLYAMLTGRPAARGADTRAVLNSIVHDEFPPPSGAGAECDERLDAIVMRALARDPEERYDSTDSMSAALRAWLEPAPAGESGASAHGTVEFLLRRMRLKSDFPGLANSIGAINVAANRDKEPASSLCAAILKDFALTNKLLRLVNAATYKHMGGPVGTVSRAVAILGFDTVRSVAMSLVLFEQMHNRTQAAGLREDVVGSYFSGMIARSLAARMQVADPEEAFICAMFHRLGRMLVRFYLTEEWEAIERLMHANGGDEGRAAREVLGMPLEDLGAGIAKRWGFPDKMGASMKPLEEPPKALPTGEAERMRALTEMSNLLAEAAREDDEAGRARRLKAVGAKFGRAVELDDAALARLAAEAATRLKQEAREMGVPIRRSASLEGAIALHAATSETVAAKAAAAAGAATGAATGAAAATLIAVSGLPGGEVTTMLEQTQLGDPDPANAFAASGDAPSGDAPAADRRAALTAGVQDITQALVGGAGLQDVMRIVLETMFRAMGFTRVLLFVRDPRAEALRCRIGFGDAAETLVRHAMTIPLAQRRDVFFAATGRGVDICVEDASAPSIREHIPAWYRESLAAAGANAPGGFVLFPLNTNGRPVALLYADAADTARLRFAPEELNLLKTLRNQALLALRSSGGA